MTNKDGFSRAELPALLFLIWAGAIGLSAGVHFLWHRLPWYAWVSVIVGVPIALFATVMVLGSVLLAREKRRLSAGARNAPVDDEESGTQQ